MKASPFLWARRAENKEKNMDTIHPLGLATMIATHQPFALIDVRPRDQFECSHIRGARSIPLDRLCPAKIMREYGNDDLGPLFLVCRRGIRASLAAGMLRPTGRLRPIIVTGGMERWEAQALPTVHTLRMQIPPPLRRLLAAGPAASDRSSRGAQESPGKNRPDISAANRQ